MKKLISFMLSVINKDAAVDIILGYLEAQAMKTSNKIDDKIVEALKRLR